MLDVLVVVAALALTPASPQAQVGQQATSLLGKPLIPTPPSAEARATLEKNLAAARAEYEKNPDSADAIIWLGRRLAYLGRYRDAIDVFSEGIRKHPKDARMYRHRGHRYITVRQLDRAAEDLSAAAKLVAGRPDEVEPDGQPNARNIPTSTLNSNIYYHLALAHYLRGAFEPSLKAWRECERYSKNPDMLVATSHWLYMTLRRLDRPGEARQVLDPISADMEIIENGSYHRLLRVFKGELTAESLLAAGGAGLDTVTTRYGLAAWHLANGRKDAAVTLLREIVEGNAQQWPAFGYIAAEAELSRSR